jgi:tetratricopeptide (TPR) repeat protein
MLAYHGANPSHFAALVGEGPLNTDDHQRLEYLGARNMFLGRNADLLEVDSGFDLQPDGLTDSLFDRYLLWREAQGEPLHQQEFQATLASVDNILTREHRMAKSLRSRAPRATDTGAASRPARGLQVEIAQMGFSEAFNWAQIVQSTQGFEAAIPYLEQAVRKEPTNSGASIALAQAYDRAGRSEDCVNALLAVMNAGTTRTDPKLSLARLAMGAGRMDEARKMLEELVEYEENGDALYLLGEVVGRSGDVVRAGEYFRRAILRDAKLRNWQAAMNYTQVLRMQAESLPASDSAGKRKLLEAARSEIRYALYHNPSVADLTQQLASIEVDLARLGSAN